MKRILGDLRARVSARAVPPNIGAVDDSAHEENAVIVRLKDDANAFASVNRSIVGEGGATPQALDQILSDHPTIFGYPLGARRTFRDRAAAAARGTPTARGIHWDLGDERRSLGDPGVVGTPAERSTPGINVLRLPSYLRASDVARAISSDPRVQHAYVPPVRRALGTAVTAQSNDPYFGDQYSATRCGFPAAWAKYEPASGVAPSPVVIIDTGYAPAHPDLPSAGRYETFGSSSYDKCGHGTRVAGLLCAKRGNGYGLAGGATCTPFIHKVFAPGYVFDDYHAALDAAAASDARVINISLGSAKDDPVEHEKINACLTKGKIVVAAIGNHPTDPGPVFPALYPGVVAVSATDKTDQLSTLSIDDDRADIAAPGEKLITTSSSGTAYAWVWGTSFATPLVSAACILILRAYPDASGDEVRARLQLLVAPGTSGNGRGRGRLDLSNL